MQYSLTTTAKDIWQAHSHDAIVKFSAGKFASSATSVYIRPVNTLNAWIILNAAGKSSDQIMVPHGVQLEAYTDAGTADLAVLKLCCSSSEPQQ